MRLMIYPTGYTVKALVEQSYDLGQRQT